MNVKIDSVHFDADKKLIDFIERKISKLIKKESSVIKTDVILKLDNSTGRENKIAEIKLKVPNDEFFAKKQTKSFEESVDSSIHALEKQLSKYKDKHGK
jgi:putative sigma-54 modulation protein